MFEESNIPEKYRDKTLQNYVVTPGTAEGYKMVSRYVETLDEKVRNGFGMVLSGDNNSGKTHLAVAVLREAILHNVSAYFVIFGDYVNKVTRTWKPGDDEGYADLDFIRESKILVLDDVDKVNLAQDKFQVKELDLLLRARDSKGLSTIMTTNILDENGAFASTFGISIDSLIRRKNLIFEFAGGYTKNLTENLRKGW